MAALPSTQGASLFFIYLFSYLSIIYFKDKKTVGERWMNIQSEIPPAYCIGLQILTKLEPVAGKDPNIFITYCCYRYRSLDTQEQELELEVRHSDTGCSYSREHLNHHARASTLPKGKGILNIRLLAL